MLGEWDVEQDKQHGNVHTGAGICSNIKSKRKLVRCMIFHTVGILAVLDRIGECTDHLLFVHSDKSTKPAWIGLLNS